MNQELINQNFVTALSIINKALMAQQERLVFILQALNEPRLTHLIDLTDMDIIALGKLQISLDKMKDLVK